jgi:hypothetical protein
MNPIPITGVWTILYQIGIVLSLIGSWIFPLWYGVSRPWIRSDMGRHLFAYSLWSAVTLTLITLRPLLSTEPMRASVIGIILVFFLGFLGWWRAWLFYKHRNRS